MIVAKGFGNPAQTCRALNLGRSPYYLTVKERGNASIGKEIIFKSKDHPRCGYRRIQPWCVEMGIWSRKTDSLSAAHRRTSSKERAAKNGLLGQSTAERRRATRPREV